jgi:hypothetical protein
MALLADVDPATAAAHPVHDGHSIWEIVLHLTAWKLVVPRRLRGEVVQLKHHQDWPAITHFEDEGWQHALSALESAHNALLEAVLATDPKHLSELVPGHDHDCALMLHGAAHHDAYHAGQIALLKKAD